MPPPCALQARFQGDVSTWGHGGDNGAGSDGESSCGSLSSGLSPRASDMPTARAFDLDTGMQVTICRRLSPLCGIPSSIVHRAHMQRKDHVSLPDVPARCVAQVVATR